jgi:hypothetical protein
MHCLSAAYLLIRLDHGILEEEQGTNRPFSSLRYMSALFSIKNRQSTVLLAPTAYYGIDVINSLFPQGSWKHDLRAGKIVHKH